MNALENLKNAGIALPPPPAKGGLYTPVRAIGKLLFVSGVGASRIGGNECLGTVGVDVSLDEAKALAAQAALNLLSVVESNVGLDRVKSIVKLFAMVQSANDFHDQPEIINGASAVFNQVFPESTGHTRMAVGTNSLPGNLVLEMEAVFELD